MEEGKSEHFTLKNQKLIVFTTGGIMGVLVDERGQFLLIGVSHVDIHSTLEGLVEGKQVL